MQRRLIRLLGKIQYHFLNCNTLNLEFLHIKILLCCEILPDDCITVHFKLHCLSCSRILLFGVHPCSLVTVLKSQLNY